MSKTLRLHHSLPLGGGNLRHWLYHPMSLQLLNLHCFFLSSLPLLTQFHNLPPLGDIIIPLHFFFFFFLPRTCKYFYLIRGLWAFTALLPHSFLPHLSERLCPLLRLRYPLWLFPLWASWSHFLWQASSPQKVLVISATWDIRATSLSRHSTDPTCLLSSPTLMRAHILICWRQVPAKAQQAEARAPLSCLFPSGPPPWGSHQEERSFFPV